MKNIFLIALFLLLFVYTNSVSAQSTFVENCIGTWTGTLQLYKNGQNTGSVEIELSIAKTDSPNIWIWRTQYFSEKYPMTKDYKLKLIDPQKQMYITDEGDGIILNDYLFGNKLYSMFETENIYLTSTYELLNDNLVFEVTSGEKIETTNKEVRNYSVIHLQKSVLSRKK